MRIKRRDHAFHCRRDEIVIARLVPIHVILPDQFDRLCENGNLRVTVIFFILSRRRFLRVDARQDAKQQQRNQRQSNNGASHILARIGNNSTIAHSEIFGNAQSVALTLRRH
jgi:hypothetical protein